VFVTVNGRTHYRWRAVDQDGTVLDILVPPRRDQRAAVKAVSTASRRTVARRYRAVAPATCSANVRRGQSAATQKKRRSASRTRTGRPQAGRLRNSRTWRLCTRADT